MKDIDIDRYIFLKFDDIILQALNDYKNKNDGYMQTMF